MTTNDNASNRPLDLFERRNQQRLLDNASRRRGWLWSAKMDYHRARPFKASDRAALRASMTAHLLKAIAFENESGAYRAGRLP